MFFSSQLEPYQLEAKAAIGTDRILHPNTGTVHPVFQTPNSTRSFRAPTSSLCSCQAPCCVTLLHVPMGWMPLQHPGKKSTAAFLLWPVAGQPPTLPQAKAMRQEALDLRVHSSITPPHACCFAPADPLFVISTQESTSLMQYRVPRLLRTK